MGVTLTEQRIPPQQQSKGDLAPYWFQASSPPCGGQGVPLVSSASRENLKCSRLSRGWGRAQAFRVHFGLDKQEQTRREEQKKSGGGVHAFQLYVERHFHLCPQGLF